ncbi:MAG: acyl-CoA thioesterase [Phycisphaerae bacterium]|nr:acyl-CoA thioesterase [Phycisphaerae bacterium]
MYSYETVIRMQHTDAAGVMFFASVFVLAHDCYEAFLEQHGLSLGAMLDEGRFIAPIVHAEADIRKPMRLSEKITIEMTLAKTGKSSFELAYHLQNKTGETTAHVTTIHAMLDNATRKAVRTPDFFAMMLKQM